MVRLLRGKAVKNNRISALKQRCEALAEKGVRPCLGIFRVGNDADTLSYEKSIVKTMEDVGIEVRVSELQGDAPKALAELVLFDLVCKKEIDGVLPMMPLPEAFLPLLEKILPEKDVDGVLGEKSDFSPCTPEAAVRLAEHYGLLKEGVKCVVLGRSPLVGAPLAKLLRDKGFGVEVVHSQTEDPFAIVKGGDVIFSAVGKGRFLDGRYLREGQAVIDIGICDDGNGGICGDFDERIAEGSGIDYSPVPGGVGVITTTILAEHVLRSCEKRMGC